MEAVAARTPGAGSEAWLQYLQPNCLEVVVVVVVIIIVGGSSSSEVLPYGYTFALAMRPYFDSSIRPFLIV